MLMQQSSHRRRLQFHANLVVALIALTSLPTPALAQQVSDNELTNWRQRDRGTGQPTSMFGTYVRRRELLVYPFFEYYLDNDTRMRTGRSPSPKSSSRAIKTSP